MYLEMWPVIVTGQILRRLAVIYIPAKKSQGAFFCVSGKRLKSLLASVSSLHEWSLIGLPLPKERARHLCREPRASDMYTVDCAPPPGIIYHQIIPAWVCLLLRPIRICVFLLCRMLPQTLGYLHGDSDTFNCRKKTSRAVPKIQEQPSEPLFPRYFWSARKLCIWLPRRAWVGEHLAFITWCFAVGPLAPFDLFSAW